ncbi:MAG: hypothetical protein EBS93_08290 [Chitinophagia bacterium]|nr:hypothetical protein [Chitinophagia bacterium]NCA30700.1 hypothetical protein [Chitinophagia bacterium]
MFIKKRVISILKLFIRAALWLFCAEINTKNKYLLNSRGPLLIIANHPNSFLDAIIIGSRYNRRIHFLARGDVFTKRHHRFLLKLLNMIPVYRIREGKEFLHLNEYTFIESAKLLKNNEAILIFIEGTCLNTNKLQPFKKGTARILQSCHIQNLFPNIHLAGISYNNFKGIGKKVNLCFDIFTQNTPILTPKERVAFNNAVFLKLSSLILPTAHKPNLKKNALYYFNLPLYRLVYKFVDKKTKGTVFFDSVLFGTLFFLYPVYLILIIILLHCINIPQPIIFGTLALLFLLRNQTMSIS